jgi:all-trans-retinol 13,14-reductase
MEIMTVVPPHYSFWHIDEGPAAGERYSDKAEYLAAKEELTERLIDGAQRLIPDIREHILWREASTPITQERYTLASGGTSYGIESSVDQWGLHRPRTKTEIEGFYIVGSSAVYAHGIAGVMFGGLACASTILGRDLRSDVFSGKVFGDPAKLPEHGPDWDPWLVCRRLSAKHKQPAREHALTAS